MKKKSRRLYRPPQAGLFLFFILFLSILFCIPTELSAQTPDIPAPLTLNAEKISLPDLIAAIEKQVPYVFSYDKIKLSAIVIQNIHWEKTPLGRALEELQAKAQLQYTFLNNNIAITIKEPPKRKAPAGPGGGTLKGRVVDFETSQPLPGATIILQETGQSILSNEKGYYEFNHLSSGTYTITVTYTGYQKNYLPGVHVDSTKQQVYDIKMQVGSSLSEVVVHAGPRKVKSVTHTTEKELIAEIRNATGVVSGISNELIAKTGDRNAAEVVKRISGINVVDNRFIIVRGMNERYTITYLNDNLAPSTELYSKAFAYDLLPTSIIDKILVYKSPRADLSGEFAGAAVKVYTKNAMPVKHFDIGVQLADRPGSTMTTVNSYNGGKYDFLGFDDGTRKLPGFSPGYFQSNKSTANIPQAQLLNGFSPTLMYGTANSTPDMQFYANYYNAWRVGKSMHLYDLTSVTYTKETTFYNVHKQTGNTDAFQLSPGYSFDGGNVVGQNNIIGTNLQTTEIGKENVLENLTLKIDPQNTIQLKNFFVNDGRKTTSINDRRGNAVPYIDSFDLDNSRSKDIILSFQQRLLYSGNLSGYHHWGHNHPQELDWNLGYTHDMQNVPDQRISHFVTPVFDNGSALSSGLDYTAAGSNLGDFDDGYQGMISRLFIKTQENVYNASIDYSFHVSPSVQFKAGTFQEFKTRDVGRRFFRVNRGGLAPGEYSYPSNDPAGAGGGWTWGYGFNNPNLIYWRYQDLGKIWNPANFPQDGTGLWLYDGTTPVDSYVGTEQNNAGYIMGDWNPVGKALTVNGGLRVEYDVQKLSGAITPDPPNGAINVVYVDHPKTSVLPSVNLTWRPDSLFVIRAAYGRTVDRPDFRELSPYTDYDFANSEQTVGNPTIVSATIDNYDLRAEFYPRSALQNEVFNIGVFYKHLQNPIERFRAELDGFTGFSNLTDIFFLNARSAEVYGLEAEVKKSLSFIPGELFRRFSLVLNGSLIHSLAKEFPLKAVYGASDLIAPPGRPLQGQAPYVFNGGLFYEHPGIGTKIGLIYNVTGPIIYAKSTGSPIYPGAGGDSDVINSTRPDLLQLPMPLLDLSITQRIFKSLQMKFSIQNLLDQPYRIVEDHNYNQRYNPETPGQAQVSTIYGTIRTFTYYQGDNIYTRYNPGRYYLLSFTYAF